jgi:hypothetical protein
MTARPDPMQLPETAGTELVPLLAPAMRVWLAWTAVTIVVDVVVAIALVLVWPHLEAAVLAFAGGIGWATLTPLVIRRLGRALRG